MDAEVDYEPEEQPAVGAPAGGGHVRGNAGGGVGGGTSVDPTKGRGRLRGGEDDGRYAGKSGVFESIDADGSTGPAKCAANRVLHPSATPAFGGSDGNADNVPCSPPPPRPSTPFSTRSDRGLGDFCDRRARGGVGG